MAILIEGIWKCKVLGANYGLQKDDRKPNDIGLAHVTINVEITEGADKGRRASYEETIDGKSATYAAKSCLAIGWKGKTLSTIKGDCDEWIKETGGESTVEIKHLVVRKDGPKQGTTFAKVGAIGRRQPVLHQPTDSDGRERLNDADEQMQRALAEAANAGSGGATYVDDDIPFATIDVVSTGEIARCLRGF